MPQPFRRQACSAANQDLTKSGLLQMIQGQTGLTTLLDKLEDNQWSITSFNSQTREVCIQVSVPTGTTLLSVTLAVLPST